MVSKEKHVKAHERPNDAIPIAICDSFEVTLAEQRALLKSLKDILSWNMKSACNS